MQETHSLKISSDSSWSLCVLSISLEENGAGKLGNGTLFGIGPESEDLSPLEAVLSSGDEPASCPMTYKILEVCIVEVHCHVCKII